MKDFAGSLIDTRARNALIRSVRCLGERGFALLTQRWKTLQHVTASAGRIGLIARIRPGAIRAQDAHVKVVEKTSGVLPVVCRRCGR